MNHNNASTVRVGDRVKLNLAYFVPERHLNGREGEIASRIGSSRVVVRLDNGQEVISANVSKVESLAPWERELLGVRAGGLVSAPAPAEPDAAPLVSLKRAQAVFIAKTILGEDASVSDIVEAATFLEAAAVEGEKPTPAPAPAVPSTEDLEMQDADGDRISVLYRNHDSARPVSIAANMVYLDQGQLAQLIARLQQHLAAAQAETTPF